MKIAYAAESISSCMRFFYNIVIYNHLTKSDKLKLSGEELKMAELLTNPMFVGGKKKPYKILLSDDI